MESKTPPPTSQMPKPPARPPQDNQPLERHLVLPADTAKVHLRVEVPPGACLEVDVEAHTADGRSLGRQQLTFGGAAGPTSISRSSSLPAALPPTGFWPRLSARLRAAPAALSAWLMFAALAVYAFTRLFALPDFPIYFFTDEAIQTVQAADLIRDRLQNNYGEFLPTFFENGSQFNLGASVYLQTLPYFFFGKSIWVTRGAAALMTLVAAASVCLILKRVFKSPYPWLAVLFLALTPAWFLHSRTAFETALAVSFYAAFLYFYLLYRAENPRYLFGAVGAAALTFYSYSPARMVILVTALLLFFSDLNYHWRSRKTVLLGLGLALLLAVPFLRFLVNHPDANQWQMRLLGSYWIMNIPLWEKLSSYAAEYLRGLDIIYYWYLPHSQDLPRHTMLDYGHLLRQTLPLGLIGLGLALYRIRSSAHRTLLIAFFAAPTGAALVKLGITRALVMVIPMALLTALAASEIMEWLHRRKNFSRAWMSVGMFALLSAGSLFMLRDALVNGPFWYSDYGLTGQQYGARQIFPEIQQTLRGAPQTHLILSPSWANGTDVIARFFFPDPLPFEMGSASAYYNEVRPLDENTLFVMIPEEYAEIPREKFAEVKVEKILPYPDGRPGFYFVRLKYIENIEMLLTEEKEQRHQLMTATLSPDGESVVTLNHSRIDMGEPRHLFDKNIDTLIRSAAINPLILEFSLNSPEPMKAVSFLVGGAATSIRLEVWPADGTEPGLFSQSAPEVPRPREVRVDFGSTITVQRMRVEVLNTTDPPEGHVHLWEVIFEQE